jgi:hypothetical protein
MLDGEQKKVLMDFQEILSAGRGDGLTRVGLSIQLNLLKQQMVIANCLTDIVNHGVGVKR